MKIKYSLLLLLFASLSFGLIGCSDDDDDSNNPIIEEEVNIGIDKDLVDIAMEEFASVKITEGNGEYNAFSLNKDVAIVSLSENNLEIQGVGIGKTSVIISDKETQLKVLPVVVYQYNEIVVDESNLAFDFLLGNEKSAQINILEGNGGYTATSDNDQLNVSVSGDRITISTIRGSQGGTANITITDACDRKTIVKVEANATTDPYSEEELTNMMANASARYYFNGNTGYSSYGTKLNTTENGMNLYGWEYYSYYYLKVYFPGDKSVGEKAGSKINYQYYSGPSIDSGDLTTCKIIKNDGSNIWLVFAYMDNGVLIPGYIVAPL